jgi:hypothetical protein
MFKRIEKKVIVLSEKRLEKITGIRTTIRTEYGMERGIFYLIENHHRNLKRYLP